MCVLLQNRSISDHSSISTWWDIGPFFIGTWWDSHCVLNGFLSRRKFKLTRLNWASCQEDAMVSTLVISDLLHPTVNTNCSVLVVDESSHSWILFVRSVNEYRLFPLLHFHNIVEVWRFCCTSRSPVSEQKLFVVKVSVSKKPPPRGSVSKLYSFYLEAFWVWIQKRAPGLCFPGSTSCWHTSPGKVSLMESWQTRNFS